MEGEVLKIKYGVTKLPIILIAKFCDVEINRFCLWVIIN